MPKILAFLLAGKVQGVKMRRYVESAARHFGLAGYVINITETGDVFGQAWERQGSVDEHEQEQNQPLDQFRTWVRGEWEPKVFHNIKPTPIGTAYPEKAGVHRCATLYYDWNEDRERNVVNNDNWMERFDTFTMVRDDQEAETLASGQIELQRRLSTSDDGDGAVATCAWPEPTATLSPV